MFFIDPIMSLAFSLSLMSSVAWSAAASVTKFPVLPRMANQSLGGVSPAEGTRKYFADVYCTPAQRAIEEQAWSDAGRYAQALASWRPDNGTYQAAMDLYMGTDSVGPLSEVLEANINGALNVHDLSTWPERQKVFVFCNEPAHNAGSCDGEQALAYVEIDEGIYYNNHYVTFCPLYYNSDLPSLSQVIADVEQGIKNSSIAYTFTQNQGAVYFHESLHFANLTTALGHDVVDKYLNEPRTYGAEMVADEAARENTVATIHIADAYECAAAAIFAQQQFNLSSPPLPGKSAANSLIARPISQVVRRSDFAWRHPQLPNPDTPDNHIFFNGYGIGPIAPTITPVSASHQLVPGSISLLKRVAWPANFSCTPENGCTRPVAGTIATAISGPLICVLVAGLCVLSFFL